MLMAARGSWVDLIMIPRGLLLLLVWTTCSCDAFAPSAMQLQAPSWNSTPSITSTGISHRERRTSLRGGLFGAGKKKEKGELPTNAADESVPTRVLSIPVSSMKKGGLRFALGLHLIGQQDTDGTWKANQENDSTLDMYFKDNSAMFKVVLADDSVQVLRFGTPSLAYVLQESVVLHSVLDELHTLSFEGDIEASNRLLQLEEPGDAIEKARALLPARKA